MTVRIASAVPQFAVPDVVRTAQYYERVLGFEIEGYWDGSRTHHNDQVPAVFAIVRRDRVRVHFNRADASDTRRERTAGGYDVYFHVTGIEELAAELARRGADILDGPEEMSYGQHELVIRDCNGLILAFAEEIGSVTEDEN